MLSQSRPAPRRTRLGAAVIGLALSAGTYAAWAAQPPELAPLGTAPERPAADFDARVKYTVDGEQSGRFVVSQNFGARFVLTDADHPALPPLAVTVTPVMHVGMAYDVQTELLRASGPEPGPRLVMRDGRIASARVETANGGEFGSVEVTIAVEARDIKAAQAAARPLPPPPPAPPLPPTVPPPPAAPVMLDMATPPRVGPARPASGQQSAQEDAQSRQTTPPNYPADALAEGRAVTAMLQVDIDAQGGVLAARVERSSGDPRLDASVLAAAKRWRFYPNIRNGKAVPGRLRIPVQFTKDVPPAIPPPPSPPPPLPAGAVPPPPPTAPAASARQSGMNLRAGTVGASAAVRPDASMPEVLPGGMPPVYPAELNRRGVGGTVHLLVDVAANGSVRQAKIEFSSGNRELDAAALEAVGSWRFRPALKDGKAVAGQVRVPVMFQPPAEATD